MMFCIINQAQSVEGIYLNKVNATSTFELKIKTINDTLVYYELFEINPTNEFIKENKTMGVAQYKKGNFSPLYSLSFMKNFEFQIVDTKTLFINPATIDFYPTFKDFGGKYFRNDSIGRIVEPLYSNFYRDNYYYEYSINNPNDIIMYDYPIVCKKRHGVHLLIGAEVRMLTYLYNCKTNEEGLYYLKIKQNDKWISGWVKESELKKFHFLWKYQNGYKYIKPKK
jgi:hypothetical protein